MNYNLGEKLKSLRKARDLTQEQLAESLCISSQAVSKWETNASFPDITMLPVLAHFYGVTTDELLGVDIEKTKEKIKAYSDNVYALYETWNYKEMVEVARKAVAEFPGDDETLFNLAWSLGQAQNAIRTKEENLKEAIKISERILNDSSDTVLRIKTTSLLSYLYHWLGDDNKSLEFANQLPSMARTSDYIIGRLGLKQGKEKISFSKRKIEDYYEALSENVKILVDFNFSIPDSEMKLLPESRIKMIKQLMQIQSIVFGENLLFENFNAMQFCYTIAKLYILDGNTVNAIEYLEKSLEYADKYEKYDEKSCYESDLLFGEAPNERTLWSQSSYESLLFEIKYSKFSGIYGKLDGNSRYEEFVKKLMGKAK